MVVLAACGGVVLTVMVIALVIKMGFVTVSVPSDADRALLGDEVTGSINNGPSPRCSTVLHTLSITGDVRSCIVAKAR